MPTDFPHTDLRTGLRYRVARLATATAPHKILMHEYETGTVVPAGTSHHAAWCDPRDFLAPRLRIA